MFRLALGCLALCLCLGLFPAAAPARAQEPATTLSWLVGDWESGDAVDGLTLEHWQPMRGGVMLGLSQTIRRQVSRGFEYMRIVRHVDGLVFYGQPNGEDAVAFRLVALTEVAREGRFEVVFANPAHDYPKRISYRLVGENGDLLVATASGANPQTDSMTWHYRRVAPAIRRIPQQ